MSVALIVLVSLVGLTWGSLTHNCTKTDVLVIIDSSGISKDSFTDVISFIKVIHQSIVMADESVRWYFLRQVYQIGYITQRIYNFSAKWTHRKYTIDNITMATKYVADEIFFLPWNENNRAGNDLRSFKILIITFRKTVDIHEIKKNRNIILRHGGEIIVVGNVTSDIGMGYTGRSDHIFNTLFTETLHSVMDTTAHVLCPRTSNTNDWTECNVECGEGLQHQINTCPKDACEPYNITRVCYKFCPEKCQKSPFSLFFLLDVSGSILQNEFDKVRRFLTQLSILWFIGEKKIDIALATFNKNVSEYIGLGKKTSTDNFLWVVDNIHKPVIGVTFTHTALDYVRDVVIKRNNVMVVIITDGLCTNRTLAANSANQLREIVPHLFAVAIGDMGRNGFRENPRLINKSSNLFFLDALNSKQAIGSLLASTFCLPKLPIW